MLICVLNGYAGGIHCDLYSFLNSSIQQTCKTNDAKTHDEERLRPQTCQRLVTKYYVFFTQPSYHPDCRIGLG